jgi:hypothetical protein
MENYMPVPGVIGSRIPSVPLPVKIRKNWTCLLFMLNYRHIMNRGVEETLHLEQITGSWQ